MDSVPDSETARQFRLLKQNVSIHASLRGEYTRKAKAAEIVLLISSLIFGVTTFAGSDFFAFLGLSAEDGRVILGIASVAAFASSLIVLFIDWSGRAALHNEATSRFYEVLQQFRECRTDDGSWPPDQRSRLAIAYRDLHRNTVSIPNRRFSPLKARYLRQVETNTLKDQYPGCPRILLVLFIGVRDSIKALQSLSTETPQRNEHNS
jgi:hypothetical protein